MWPLSSPFIHFLPLSRVLQSSFSSRWTSLCSQAVVIGRLNHLIWLLFMPKSCSKLPRCLSSSPRPRPQRQVQLPYGSEEPHLGFLSLRTRPKAQTRMDWCPKYSRYHTKQPVKPRFTFTNLINTNSVVLDCHSIHFWSYIKTAMNLENTIRMEIFWLSNGRRTCSCSWLKTVLIVVLVTLHLSVRKKRGAIIKLPLVSIFW